MVHLDGSPPLWQTYYSTVIFEQSVGVCHLNYCEARSCTATDRFFAGLSRHLSLLMGGFLQVWFFVASLATWFLIDRFGRRQLFMFGYSGFGELPQLNDRWSCAEL